KRVFAVVLACLLMFSLSACGSDGSGGSKNNGDTITIAYIGPLTGEGAAWGQPELNTIQMMVDKVNEEEGGILGKKIILKSYDNRGDNVETTNAAKKAIQNDGACAIIGCNGSGATLALASVCEEFKVPNIATTATNSKVTIDDNGKVRPWTFRVILADPQYGEIMADYAYNKMGIRKVGILYEVSSDYSSGITQNFTSSFKKLGGTITAAEAYKQGDVDFRAQLAKLNQSNPEALFLPMTYKELGLATKQARSLGMQHKFLGPDCWMNNDLFSVAGDAIEGSVFVAPIDGSDPALDEFKKWYREVNNNEEPDAAGSNAYFAYDAFVYLKAAIEKAGTADSAAIRDALEEVEKVEGLTGAITMLKDSHNPIRSVNIFEVKKDHFESISNFIVEYK
ncbi:MAG TPA: ABC transporter substrate-binding protein, partial [Clostridia bacterium]|nr:ABC transporter substrate-binding protein [Clostridia bacterium]